MNFSMKSFCEGLLNYRQSSSTKYFQSRVSNLVCHEMALYMTNQSRSTWGRSRESANEAICIGIRRPKRKNLWWRTPVVRSQICDFFRYFWHNFTISVPDLSARNVWGDFRSIWGDTRWSDDSAHGGVWWSGGGAWRCARLCSTYM